MLKKNKEKDKHERGFGILDLSRQIKDMAIPGNIEELKPPGKKKKQYEKVLDSYIFTCCIQKFWKLFFKSCKNVLWVIVCNIIVLHFTICEKPSWFFTPNICEKK